MNYQQIRIDPRICKEIKELKMKIDKQNKMIGKKPIPMSKASTIYYMKSKQKGVLQILGEIL